MECIVDAATGPSPDRRRRRSSSRPRRATCTRPARRPACGAWWWCPSSGPTASAAATAPPKVAHEQAVLAGPIPARVLRAAQFHEFVAQLVEWGMQGDVSYVPKMRTQLVAARTVARRSPSWPPTPPRPHSGPPFPEIAGPREERLADAGELLVSRRGDPIRIEEVSDPGRPGRRRSSSGRAAARAGRHPRRPDVRGVAGSHAAGSCEALGTGFKSPCVVGGSKRAGAPGLARLSRASPGSPQVCRGFRDLRTPCDS